MSYLKLSWHDNGKPKSRNEHSNTQITVANLPRKWGATVYQRSFIGTGRRVILAFSGSSRRGFRAVHRMKKGKDKDKLRFAAMTKFPVEKGHCTSPIKFDMGEFLVWVDVTPE